MLGGGHRQERVLAEGVIVDEGAVVVPEDDPKHMPPLRFRRLSADEIARASSALMP